MDVAVEPADADAADRIERFAADGYARLVRAVAVYCGDRAAAEDAVQEAMAKAWDRLDRGVAIDALDRWTAVVAFNAVRSRFRSLRREDLTDTLLADGAGASDGHPDPDGALLAAVRQLPHRQRVSVLLVYYLDLPLREAAGVMGVSEGTVKNALFRARQTLAARLSSVNGYGGPHGAH
jgi:RNA polymerase sigma-70 factor, ECF subfamily